MREVSPLLARDPRLAVALTIAEMADSRDPATMLPLLDDALRVHRSMGLLRRKANILYSAGELSASREAWQELAARGDPAGSKKVRWIDGRLIETDTEWLPSTSGPPEQLVPLRRSRILHIAKNAAPQRWSGFTIRTLQNLRAQRSVGLEPIVVTGIGWPREAGVTDVPGMVTFEGFEHYYLDRGPKYRPTSLPNDIPLRDMAEALVPLVRELRPAVLHVHSGYRGGELALVALALREHFGIPVVYEVRGAFESTWSADRRFNERAEMYARRLAQETRILREVDGVAVISEALAAELIGRGIAGNKITLVPNGVDAAALDDPPRDPDLRRELHLEDRHVVGYLGNLDSLREGIDVLLHALADLRARGRDDIALLIVGEGTQRANLQAAARRLGVADACRFTGRVPHELVGAYYAQMDVFVNPRVDERAARLITPLKPFEAMAVGIPVLVSDLPALREIVDPPHRGVVAPPGDPKQLANAIADLVDDAGLRGRLAAAGRQWVHSERTWTANGPRYRSAYERILGPLD